MIRVQRVTRRFYWWHAYYREAKRNGYACYKPWRLYIDVVVGYRYFINHREVSLGELCT